MSFVCLVYIASVRSIAVDSVNHIMSCRLANVGNILRTHSVVLTCVCIL